MTREDDEQKISAVAKSVIEANADYERGGSLRTLKTSRSSVPRNFGASSLVGIVLIVALVLLMPRAHAQAAPSAVGPSGLFQVGAQFAWANSDYASQALAGYGFYATSRLISRFRIEGDFRQSSNPGSRAPIYERSFEAGPQYMFRAGPFQPYVKAMVGRGVFNFPPSPRNPGAGAVANLAFGMFAFGGGVEYKLEKPISLRLDYEYQQWMGFPPHGLSPQVVSMGVAYRFH